MWADARLRTIKIVTIFTVSRTQCEDLSTESCIWRKYTLIRANFGCDAIKWRENAKTAKSNRKHWRVQALDTSSDWVVIIETQTKAKVHNFMRTTAKSEHRVYANRESDSVWLVVILVSLLANPYLWTKPSSRPESISWLKKSLSTLLLYKKFTEIAVELKSMSYCGQNQKTSIESGVFGLTLA